jgi:thiamine-phosphate pyrophosphorylase
MSRRQTVPRQWLVADERLGGDLWRALRGMPRGSGIFILYHGLPRGERARLLRKLRRLARSRQLLLVDEASGNAVRVHRPSELLRAGLARTPLLFLSPVFSTRSHPDWRPLKRQRIGALLRLSRAPVIALGGMNARRFRTVVRLGFAGWAGMDAWRKP